MAQMVDRLLRICPAEIIFYSSSNCSNCEKIYFFFCLRYQKIIVDKDESEQNKAVNVDFSSMPVIAVTT